MTDLQMGMIGLGAAAVIGVVIYNKWQERRHRKLADELLSSRQTDVLLDDGFDGGAAADESPGDAGARSAVGGAARRPGEQRVEPLLRGEADFAEDGAEGETAATLQTPPFQSPAERPVVAQSARREPARKPGGEERPDPRSGTAPLYLLSPAIDYIAAIELSESAGAYQIFEAQRAAIARLGKPVNWIGFNEESHEWEPIAEDSDCAYRHIRVGLQLVDRKGPVRDGDLSVFHVAMQELADELLGVVELPLREPALAMAAELDEFCAGVDIQIGINVVSQGQVFAGTKLRGLAESAGMVLDGEGRFARCDDEGNVLYVLLNQEDQPFSTETMRSLATHGVTFLLDVPRVGNGDRVLIQMVEQARRFADALHGAVVDDNRRPLSDAAIEPIRRQVAQFQASMALRHLPAGRALAQRLFA
ncbi:cell division protein ZipA C-terminal FtsZ-binding domain-containing protein [Accumulibacter sp.]|uniref:cell division protein ZipA C-terminal FtsZ-binding domain-containing protein n=1 Tax=Accumulibacter sp. TaxID=2053492 RepID=UPI0025F38487|nr:cell division protein ZipA C-terminal FtsZ-binding domain-containing protein [Accumulibacter sp.]MCM8594473.1 cell division protein ZipA C-terminal FtsZ-binding domain-containing protein [Accumulibacter sp.]MDS4048619.1 cell division protein ZipA C-terminal FtsZ-binding domain-containing protein [Accumulibacter sp.]